MDGGTFVAMVRGQAALSPDGSLRRFPTQQTAEDYVREQDARLDEKPKPGLVKRPGPEPPPRRWRRLGR
jgi:hypothetical protein